MAFCAITGLGQALGIPVLVEGVETQEQVDFAVALGCSEIQGYFSGRPVPESGVLALLAAAGGTGKAMGRQLGDLDFTPQVPLIKEAVG